MTGDFLLMAALALVLAGVVIGLGFWLGVPAMIAGTAVLLAAGLAWANRQQRRPS